jgi:serine/threonine-protein kinase
VVSLKTGVRTTLIRHGGFARYVPTGHILYARPWQGGVWAAPFDVDRLVVTGSAFPVLDGVRMDFSGAAHYDVSETGTLVYVSGSPVTVKRKLFWVDRKGNREVLPLPPDDYSMPRLSPNGKQLAYKTKKPYEPRNVWICDLGRATSTRLTDDKGDDYWPVWSPDGKMVAYSSTRYGRLERNLFWQSADGNRAEERLTESPFYQEPQYWSSDGRLLFFVQSGSPSTGFDIFVLPLEGDREPRPVLQESYNEFHPAPSPNGRWLAYVSEETGQAEVYIRPYPGPGAPQRVSTAGGREPLWALDGKELFYRAGTDQGVAVMAVSIQTEPELAMGTPIPLFQGNYVWSWPFGRNYDISRDGQRFLMIENSDPPPAATEFEVVLNWYEEFRDRERD